MSNPEESPIYTDTDPTNETRRQLLKGFAVAATTGALGSLAGCNESDDEGGAGFGGDGKTDSVESGGGGTSSLETRESDGGGGSEEVTLTFMTPDPTESSGHKSFYQDQMNKFEEKQGGVSIDFQGIGWGTLWEKLPAMASSGDLPDVSMSGAVGLQLGLEQDVLIDHGSFIEETEGLPEKLVSAHVETMNYRDSWWTAGSHYTQATMLGIRPKFFKEVGVSDPSDIDTWSGFRQAVDEIDKQFSNVNAFEATVPYRSMLTSERTSGTVIVTVSSYPRMYPLRDPFDCIPLEMTDGYWHFVHLNIPDVLSIPGILIHWEVLPINLDQSRVQIVELGKRLCGLNWYKDHEYSGLIRLS